MPQREVSLQAAASAALASSNLAKGDGISGKAAMKSRLSRQITMKSLVSDSAVQARVALRQFASYPRPRYTRWRSILYGSFIDWAICLRLPLGDNVFGFIAKRGGPEQVRLLLTFARFDEDGDGTISDEEFAHFLQASDEIIADANAMCGNLAVVSALLLGLSHNVTVGRPVPLAYAPDVETQYGEWLLWVVYALNLCAESGAFFTMCLAIITRNCVYAAPSGFLRASPGLAARSRICSAALTPPGHVCSTQDQHHSNTPAQGRFLTNDERTGAPRHRHPGELVVLPAQHDNGNADHVPAPRDSWLRHHAAAPSRVHELHRPGTRKITLHPLDPK